jgi:hypothetical protein
MPIHSVEFNKFERFKDFRQTTDRPVTTQAQGISFFLGSPMGKRIREHAEPCADKAAVSCFDDALYCVIRVPQCPDIKNWVLPHASMNADTRQRPDANGSNCRASTTGTP